METIYADFNATTPLGPSATERMSRAFEIWGNPSSSHRVGRKAQEFLEASRQLVADAVGIKETEVVFTSGGSEANTFALMGSWLAGGECRLLTSRVEHSSIRDTVALLESRGAQVSYVKLSPQGELDLEAFAGQLEEFKPTLVSLMTANNETGVLFPIPKAARLCRETGITFHTDAVQAFGKVPPAFFRSADLISLSAHKIHGPKGAGALVVRNGKKLVPTHYGGSQEIKRRGGTENVVGIAGLGGACQELLPESALSDLAALRDSFETQVSALEGCSVIGGKANRLPNTSSIRLAGIPSEVVLSALDLDGICVSAGSACSSGSIKPSHVLLEMGLTPEEARECLRFSWGKTTTAAHVDTVASAVISHVNRIRARRGTGTRT